MKKLFKILLTVLVGCIFLMETKAYENDNVEISITGIDYTKNTPLLGAKVEYTGITTGSNDTLFMCGNSALLEDTLDFEYDDDIYESNIANGFSGTDTYGKVAMRNPDVYAAFYRYSNENRKYTKISNTVLITRPKFPVNRTFNVFFLNDISIYPEDFDDLNASKTIHYKVGHVTNNTIIRNVKNGNYDSLYNFAKNDTNPIVTNQVTCTNVCSIPNNLNERDFTLNDFYYVYTYRDTENGKYVELEDISLYQRLRNNDYVFLSDTGLDDYTWGDIGDDDEPTAYLRFGSESYVCEEGTTIETYILSSSAFELISADETIATVRAGAGNNTPVNGTRINTTNDSCPVDRTDCYEVEIVCHAQGSVRLTATNEEDVTATKEVTVSEELVPVTITYTLEDGIVCKDETKTVDSGNKWGVLCTPTRSGYTFEGWYTAKTGGTKVTKNTVATGDIVVYARWSKVKNPKTGVATPILGLLIMTCVSVLTFIILTKKSKQFNQ